MVQQIVGALPLAIAGETGIGFYQVAAVNLRVCVECKESAVGAVRTARQWRDLNERTVEWIVGCLGCVGQIALPRRQINRADFRCRVVGELAVPLAAVVTKQTATRLNGGVLRSAVVLHAVGALGFLIVEGCVVETNVATNDDLTVLIGQL